MSRLDGVERGGKRSGRGDGPGRLAGAVLAAGAVLSLAILVGLTTNTSPAGAVFPGTNGNIVCQGQRGVVPNAEIFSVNPDGSDERVLTNNATSDVDPAFSPDGKKIAFAAQRDPTQPTNQDIYVADNDGDLEGADVKRLTTNTAGERSPSWSPDGTQIVFHSSRSATFSDGGTTPANDVEIYKMSAITGDTAEQPAVRLTNSRGQDAIPSWSPDGTKIAWQRLAQGVNPMTDPLRSQNLEVWTMNPDGTGQTNVSNSPGSANDPNTPANENSNGLDRDVRWSPDSAQLAFSSTRDDVTPGNQNFEVYKMNRNGSNQTRLTSNLSGDSPGADNDYDAPNTWSPDGKRILFSSGRTSTPDTTEVLAFTMDANTGEAGGLQRVAETDFFVRCDWRAVAPASAPPGGGGYPLPPGGGPAPPKPKPKAKGCVNSAGVRVLGKTNSGGRVLQGRKGNDRICGTSRGDVITGNGGKDVISGGGGNDRINGGSGSDRINGGSGKDRISGSSGNDVISGSSGNDRINGNSGKDRINGNSGNDRLNGSTGNDIVSGSSGKDVISGSSGSDRLSGNSGNDRINGNSGNDRISGGSGNDRLKGSSGNDRIDGGAGRDRISGGSGRDKVKQ